MATVRTWEAVRHRGVICISVPGCNWVRTAHEWEIDRLRGYLRAARYIPADTRIEIARWLEHQEAFIQGELEAASELPPVFAERLAWVLYFAAIVGMAVAGITLTEAML